MVVVEDTRVVEEEEDTAEEEVATEVVVVATVVEGIMSDELPLLEITTDEVATLVDTLHDETTTVGMNLEGTTIDVMIDLPGETMTETGVLHEGKQGTTEIDTMTEIDPSELPLPKQTVETRKYHASPLGTIS